MIGGNGGRRGKREGVNWGTRGVVELKGDKGQEATGEKGTPEEQSGEGKENCPPPEAFY